MIADKSAKECPKCAGISGGITTVTHPDPLYTVFFGCNVCGWGYCSHGCTSEQSDDLSRLFQLAWSWRDGGDWRNDPNTGRKDGARMDTTDPYEATSAAEPFLGYAVVQNYEFPIPMDAS